MISQYFIGGMMPESANPVQQSRTVIEIRPFKGGWQCYEGPGSFGLRPEKSDLFSPRQHHAHTF
jgi:hypothetical protein